MTRYTDLSTPAKTQHGPLLDLTFGVVLNVLDSARNYLQSLCWVCGALEVFAHRFLVLGRARRKPLRLSVLAAQEVWNIDSVLVGGVAAVGKNVGALGEVGVSRCVSERLRGEKG